MGHHIFIHNEKTLRMGDWEVALVRHFLIEGARRAGDESLANEIAAWEYQCSGVWIGVNEALLADSSPVFAAGIEAVKKLGENVSTDYLNENVKVAGGRWLREQSTASVAASIHRLEEHLNERA
jgi:hypothetical protein